MNRIVIAVVLGLLAAGAAGVWALGQFGGPPPLVVEAREPFVREAQEIAAAEPAARGATTRTVTPTTPDPAAADAPAPATDAPAAATNPAAREAFRSTLDPQAPATADAPAPAADDTPVTVQTAPSQATAKERVAAPQAAAAQVEGLEAQFKSRRLTYNRPPEKLAIDKAIDISLIIDTSKQADVKERLDGLPGTIVERDVDLSDTVAAELLGAAFDIQLQTTATRQKLSSKIPNEWRWRVTPKQKGTHQLTLNVYGYAVGSADAEPLDSYSDRIIIEVEPVGELVTWARGVQPLFAVLAALAGVGSACFAFLRFREERKQTRALTPKGE